MVLASLEQLHIRALFSKMSSAVSLRRVALEVASEAGGGPPASNVELCMCPANYLGDSCQDCAPGYYRDVKGPFLGRCVPCQCHGHSDRCLPGSGVCVVSGTRCRTGAHQRHTGGDEWPQGSRDRHADAWGGMHPGQCSGWPWCSPWWELIGPSGGKQGPHHQCQPVPSPTGLPAQHGRRPL